MLDYAVAFLVLVIAFFVVRMSSVFTTSNLYLASIQELLKNLRKDIQTQEGTADNDLETISDRTKKLLFEKIYDPNRLKPVPEPGWRMGPDSYSMESAKTLEQSLAPHNEAVKLVPDPLLPGRYYVLTKPKRSESPSPDNPIEDSKGEA